MKRIMVLPGLLALAMLAAGCPKALEAVKEAIKTPTVSVEKVAVTGISSSNIDFELGLAIDNPNPVGLTLSGLEYSFDLMERPLFSGSDENKLSLAASGSSKVNIPVSVAYRDILAIYEAAKGLDELPYKLSGKTRIVTPIGEIPVPFKTSGNLPVIRPPKIQGIDAKVRKLGFSGIDIDVIMKLGNPNAFDLDIKSIDYALKLSGKDFISGKVESQTVPKKSSGSLRVPVSIDTSQLSWVKSLVTGGSVDYSLDYKAVYNLKGLPLKQNENFQGTLKFGR